MTISYKWLSEYLPVNVPVSELSEILTSIGLEVESVEPTGNAHVFPEGLVSGKVLTCVPHPNADKLRLTTVDVGKDEPLSIVCGAPNVAVGQSVIVATIGTTLQPATGEPFKIKKSKIRGEESLGMLCAADEIGLSNDHEGLLLLPEETKPGTPLSDIIKDEDADIVLEIGLTPNRSDAMSHLGVARDVCAYLSHHRGEKLHPVSPYKTIKSKGASPVQVVIEDATACTRYSGVSIQGIKVGDSPEWLQKKLKAIGVNAINNIVDITNFILHATGQPLHAFDADKISNNTIIVKKAKDKESFITLDNKKLELTANDLMICDAEKSLCIAGVYGGINSGVTNATTNLFLESACFTAENIRITSTYHQLRTDAATRFEKGSDFSITEKVLQYAASLITEIAGGMIIGDIVDVIPNQLEKKVITLEKKYLKTLSGVDYADADVQQILTDLGYHIISQSSSSWEIEVPFHKTFVQYAADIVQEVMRINGFDKVLIPPTLSLIPVTDDQHWKYTLREKTASTLIGSGFMEIFTNSIVNSKWFDESQAENQVRLMNSLSAELDILRPMMLQSGLQSIAYNLNRKNDNIRFFEFGKTYHNYNQNYNEQFHLALYLAGNAPSDWKHATEPYNYFMLKGHVTQLLKSLGLDIQFKYANRNDFKALNEIFVGKKKCGLVSEVHPTVLKQAGIKVPVFYAEINWSAIESLYQTDVTYKEISRFPSAERDLAIVVDLSVTYSEILNATKQSNLTKLENMELFDVFESEKLGPGKKSMAMKYIFSDDAKTLTDEEIDQMMWKLTETYTRNLNAEVRK